MIKSKITENDLIQINVNDLLREFRQNYKEMFITSKLEMNGINVGLTKTTPHYGGERVWFICPSCKQRCGVLCKHINLNNVTCKACLS